MIQWSDGSRADATWEPKEKITAHYPDLKLEDKFVVEGGDDDTVAKDLDLPITIKKREEDVDFAS